MVQKRIDDYLQILKRVGMQTVTAIRKSKVSNWDDHSGNLRSSIGFIVMHDGREFARNFELYNGRGEEGLKKGQSYAEELASQYPNGFALIIVAGMEYAAYVESIQSKIVLEGGRKLSKDLYKELVSKFEAKYGK